MRGPVLTVSNARKAFGQTIALHGAALELRSGECLGLLGPNGAGKTTLVRAITGRVSLDDGEISLFGQRLNGSAARAAEARARLGIVPQDIAIYPLLTPRENLMAFGGLHGLSGHALRDRVNWAVQWTGLEDRANDLAKRFSGGMKRRLNIACGILHEPEVVLLDEPTVGVDPQSRQRIWEMLEQLRQQGTSVLLTTHQLDEAERVCERIVIIDHGRDIATGTLDELMDQTVGRQRSVILTLDESPDPSAFTEGLEVKGREAIAHVEDVAGELPRLLSEVHDAGRHVEDVRIVSPTLHAVFIHLTGRELRE